MDVLRGAVPVLRLRRVEWCVEGKSSGQSTSDRWGCDLTPSVRYYLISCSQTKRLGVGYFEACAFGSDDRELPMGEARPS